MLSQFCKIKPSQFKLLYKFNKLINNSFHSYTDSHPNLLILIRLTNNVVLGGFSPQAL